MDHLFNNILTNVSDELTFAGTAVTILVGMLFGAVIAYTYYKTRSEAVYSHSMTMVLFMLPVILSVIVVFVGSNVARAFSLAGTLSIIRFRSSAGDPKDIGYVFFAIAAGLACGVGLYGYGALFVVLLCAVMYIAERLHIFEQKTAYKQLRITVPESLNYSDAFESVLEKYTQKHSLIKIKTTDLGSLFEIWYNIAMKSNIDEQEFINELRCRNGNLSIQLAEQATNMK